MTNGPEAIGRSKPALIRIIVATSLIAASSTTGFVLVELLSHFFVPWTEGAYSSNNRIMFFEGGGTIFENHEDIFTYVPNSEIRHEAVYFSDDDFVVEYDYHFHTNNYGLVQEAGLAPARPSLLLLGNSFTEGQGAEPWFSELATPRKDVEYQMINGGLIGTGFEQWSKLARFLSEQGIKVEKVLILFISGDYTRRVWNFSPSILDCLAMLAACRGDEGFYRLPPASDLPPWVTKIRALRTQTGTATKYPFQGGARSWLPATFPVYDYWRAKFEKSSDIELAKQRSDAAIGTIIRRYGASNVVFMHLPQKDEPNGPSQQGVDVRRANRNAGGNLIDGYTPCRLTALDYHVHDGHPNKQGYGKIAHCVSRVVQQMATSGSDR
jgi:hypothetical protein